MKRQHSFALAATTAAVLVACGGGGGGSSATADTNAYLTGTAAYGAPMAGASITVQDATGKTVTITADSNGAYKVPVTGFTAPLLVTASVPSGDAVRTYHAVVDVAVASGASGNANVTPLTEAIAAMASSDGVSPAEFTDSAKLNGLDAAKLQKATDAVKLIIKDVATNLGDASFDPVKSSFTADHASTGDKLLETVKVSVSDAGVTLINARVSVTSADPGATAATVTIKDVTTATPAPLPKPTVTEGYTIFDPWVAQINKCLALPQGQRVSVNATGAAAAFLSECAKVTNFAAGYKRNGYTLLQYWGSQLAKWIPDGAVMGTPEVLLFLKNDAGDDMALVRLPYSSPKGGGSYFETARKVSGTWLIEGNQRNYDASIAVHALRIDDVSTYGYKPFAGPDQGKNVGNFSSYATRLAVSFNQSGPNGADVYAVRVTGPGLPAAGIVLARSYACGTSDFLSFYSNNGSVPAAPAPGTVFPLPTGSTSIGYVMDVARRGDGYKGTDFYNEWRGRNADGSPSTAPGNNTALTPIDLSTIPEFAKYTFEVFKAGSSSVADTFKARIVVRPVSSSFAASLPWADFSADSLKYTDPANAKAGELSAATISWSVPTGAPPVSSGYVFGRIYDPNLRSMTMGDAVTAVGDTSLALSAATERDGNGNACTNTKVPAFTTTTGYRELGLKQTLVNGLAMRQNVHFVGRPAI